MRHHFAKDPRVQDVISRKQRLSLWFSLLVAVPFFGFIFAMAFKPAWLAAPAAAGGAINLGLALSFLMILFMFILIWLFIRRKISEDNADLRDIIHGGTDA